MFRMCSVRTVSFINVFLMNLWEKVSPCGTHFLLLHHLFFKIIFIYVDHFKSLAIVSVLCFGFFDHKAWGVFVPGPGIKPTRSTLAAEVLTTGP